MLQDEPEGRKTGMNEQGTLFESILYKYLFPLVEEGMGNLGRVQRSCLDIQTEN